jgi:ribosome-associated toxin RatA of RatAB toxin-antitoxin module
VSDVSGSHAVAVAASLEACLAVLDDVERYPEWYDTLDRARVLERDGDRRPRRAAFAAAAGPLGTVEFTLQFSRLPPGHIVGEQVDGNGRVVRVRMAWRLEPLSGARTRAAYEFRADAANLAARAALRVARPLVQRDLVEAPPEALKRRLEGSDPR